MQVYKLTLAYTYYAMQIGAAEYMIIGYTQLTGLQNGFALGSLIDEVEPQEVEPCDAQLADFDFCQTHLFETFLKFERNIILLVVSWYKYPKLLILTGSQEIFRQDLLIKVS